MRKIYELCLIMLLFVVGGVSALAQNTPKDLNDETLTSKCDNWKSNIGYNVEQGGLYYGCPNVEENCYVDLSSYATLYLEGTPGVYRLCLNTTGTNNNKQIENVYITIGVAGYVYVDITKFYKDGTIHLNAIKNPYNSGVAATLKSLIALPYGYTKYQNAKIWDFSNANNNSLGDASADFMLKDDSNVEDLQLKGSVEIKDHYLDLKYPGNSEISNAAVKIPAPRGYIVKVTGNAASSSNHLYTWRGVYFCSNKSFNKDNLVTVEAISIADDGYVIIENTDRNTNRLFHIKRIEVLPPANATNFRYNKKSIICEGGNPEDNTLHGGYNVTYSAEGKGHEHDDNETSTTEKLTIGYDFDPATGKVSNISGTGGAIVVTATSTGYGKVTGGDNLNENGTIYQADIPISTQYVITKPYHTHEWTFYSIANNVGDNETKKELYDNVSSASEWGLTWKVRQYDDNGDKRPYYASSSVIASTVPVEGDNARFLSSTAGLIITTAEDNYDTKYKTYGFGTNISTENLFEEKDNKYNKEKAEKMLAYTLDDATDPCEGLTISDGTTLEIPNLKQGQYVRLRWNRYSDGAVGERMTAYNVTDLNHQDMSEKVFYIGSGSNSDNRMAHNEFIVKENGSVKFKLTPSDKTSNGWANIFNIKVGEVGKFVDTDLNINIAKETVNGIKYEISKPAVDRRLNIVADNGHVDLYTYLRKAGEEPISTTFETSWGETHMQSNLDWRYEIVKYYEEGTLKPENCYIDEDHKTLIVKPGVHGKFTLALKGYHNTGNNGKNNYTEVWKGEDGLSYLLDSLNTEVRVYEYDYNVKPYPYTWAMEHITTDTGNKTIEEIGKDSNMSGDGHFWDNGQIFNVGHAENLIALKTKTNTVDVSEQTVKFDVKDEINGNIYAGTKYNVKDDKGENVASIVFGEWGNDFIQPTTSSTTPPNGYEKFTEGNGDNAKNDGGSGTGGTFYTIYPQYDGKLNVGVLVNENKTLYVLEDGNTLDEKKKEFKTKESYNLELAVKGGKSYKIYAGGSKLGFYGFTYTYKATEKFIPEFNGLGFFPTEYWNHHDNKVKLDQSQNGIELSDNRSSYRLIVPNVKEKETVYLAVTGDNRSISLLETKQRIIKGTKKDETNNEVEVEVIENYEDSLTSLAPYTTGYVWVDTYNQETNSYENGWEPNIPLYIYKISSKDRTDIEGKIDSKNRDVRLLLKNVQLHKVAVSVDTKTVSEAGYATEARHYPLDFTLAKLFLGEEQKAYKVTGVTDETGGKQYVKVSEVRYIPATTKEDVRNNPVVNNGVMITGDYLPEREQRQETSWPLFTTDIDRATSDMTGNRLIGVVDNTKIGNVDQRTKYAGDNDSYYNYMLAEAGYNVVYEDEGDSDGYHEDPGKVNGGIVKGLGFYLVMKDGTLLLDGSKYLGGKPKNNSAYLQLEQRLAKKNEFSNSNSDVYSASIRQVFFIDSDSIVTGIYEVLTDDDELPSAGENAPANILQNGVFYTLQGVPVKNPTKGIYIFNGKKIYVK